MSARLRQHDVHLSDGALALRPMTEDDWDVLLEWNNDPEVLHYSEGDNVTGRSLEEIQAIYRGTSQNAFCFIAELDGRAIGECWLQQMNLQRILSRYPAKMDLRRIDLVIGEKSLWGHGWGTRMIALLTAFGFDTCGADALFACDVADTNPRSRRPFEATGYAVVNTVPQPSGRKAHEVYDLMLTRAQWQARGRPGN